MSTNNQPNPTDSERANSLFQLRDLIFGKVLACDKASFENLLATFERQPPPISAFDDDDDDADRDTTGSAKPEYLVTNSIATLPVRGLLLKRQSALTDWYGILTYQQLRRQIAACLVDPNVKGILLDCESGGGTSAGMKSLSDYIYSVRGQKPIYSISNDSMYSAAYGIGSACDKVYLTEDSGVGSIGVWSAHIDQSGLDERLGIRFRFIYNGLRKIDGNSHEPLSDRAEATMQAEVDRVAEMFIGTVARNRGVSAKAIRDTQAGILYAEAALPLLADRVGSLAECMADLMTRCGVGGVADAAPSQAVASGVLQADDDDIGPESHTAGYGALLSRMVNEARDFNLLDINEAAAAPAVRRFASHSQSTNQGPAASMKLSMLVVPYSSPSIDLGGYKEIYSPGCFSAGLDADPRATFAHDDSYVLGRKSAGTCRFYETPNGLCCEVTAPDTSWAKDLLVSMRRGDVTHSSAAFWITRSHWEKRQGERYRVIDAAIMREASIVAEPAYRAAKAAPTVPSKSTSAPTPDAATSPASIARARLRLIDLS